MNPTLKFWLVKLAYITLAIVIISVCVNMFLAPHNIAAGGLTGLAIIFEEWMGLNRTWVVLIGNASLLVVTLIFLGKEVFINTAIGASMLPAVIAITPRYTLVSDTMLSMVVGSALFGVAVSILYANKASSGGTAIPPLIFKKYFNMNTSIGLFISDGVVVLLCLLVFDRDAFFFAVASIFITSAVMSYIETGANKKKMVYIISEAHEKIIHDIQTLMNRGVTLIPSIGAFMQQEKPMLMVTMDKKDYQQLLDIVNTHDAQAFMITDTVTDVHGKGFTYESGSV
ncbi:MAG: YitT family protein [Defluviitaleaceae bacterium]|nr:YitT family protein [Defluviitaleaceae bacterium]MCL2240867.1 YitT family protein [Defluviitaleaceae bacterium]